jgi:GNAT superfamily N-acetyltransferase
MRPSYEVIRYRPDLKQQVVELQRHLWSPSPALNTACLEWKHEQNPYVDAPLIYLALCDGQVVGMRGFCGARWQVGHEGQTVLVPIAGDFVIAPEHRDRGLFTKIMTAALVDLAAHGYTYVFNLGAGPVTFVGSLAMGWRAIGSLRPVIRRERVGFDLRRVRRLVSRLPVLWRCAELVPTRPSGADRHPFRHLDRRAGRLGPHVSAHVSVARAPRPEAMAELVGRIGGDGRIRQVRDPRYFAWRFQDPLFAYRFLFWEDARLEAYLVLRSPVSRTQNGARVSIVDWEATSGEARDELLQAAIRLGRFSELMTWSATMPETTRALLRDRGFEPCVEGPEQTARLLPSVLIRPVSDEGLRGAWVLCGRRLLDMNNWDVRLLDRM